MRRWVSTSLAMTLLLGGCATHGSYTAPSVSVPATFSQGPTGLSPSDADWWKAFGDPVLTNLVERAFTSNPDIQQAAARVRQAREQERITRDNHGPQINASAQASEARLSKNALPSALAGLFSGGSGSSSSRSGLGLPGETFTTYQAGFDASWELDLFGGQQSSSDAARAQTEAAIWSARDAEVMLAAEVANTYEQYRALQRRLALADETLAAERETLAFLTATTNNGLAIDSDKQRQERQIDQAAAQRQDLAAQVDARLHALNTLLGLAPTALAGELAAAPAGGPTTPEVPAGLPSELLQRRPDLRAAERQVAVATANLNVATADLYPKISLTGALQLASRSLSSLLDSESLQDNLGGRISIPVFNRDRLHANVSLRQAQVDEAIVVYRKSVFSALRDVEDALTRLDADRRRLDQFRAAARTAKDEADTAAVRYRNGLTPATDLLAAQKTGQTARDAEVQAEAAAAQDVVALYKALGGGWDERRNPSEEDKPNGKGS